MKRADMTYQEIRFLKEHIKWKTNLTLQKR